MSRIRYIVRFLPAFGVMLALFTTGCSEGTPKTTVVPAIHQAELSPGGKTSVSYKPFPSFMLPVANMPEGQRPDFYAGKALARQPWIKAPTATTARDGLGPLYNARTCLGCHVNGGRGAVPAHGETPLFAAFVRVSVPGQDKINGAVPEPMYGNQIQGQSVSLSHQLRSTVPQKDPKLDPEAPPEATVYIDWQFKEFRYPDGEKRVLRYPTLRFERLGYGPLHPDTMTSLRAAPAIHGVGLLELIDQEDIDQLADPEDIDDNGISGRVNRVWDFVHERVVAGRFGWKANRANVRVTTASAFNGDVGITNPVFPIQPCSGSQLRCLSTPNGNDAEGVELPEHLLELVVNFTRNLGVPMRRENLSDTADGRALFYETGCVACHNPRFTTQLDTGSQKHLSGQTIWPYTDLLLHDMGPGLADGRADYEATGSEWRTPPLWGVGLNAEVNGSHFLLHDGRARDVEEAILWHGGEAQQANNGFAQLTVLQREALIRFVESL